MREQLAEQTEGQKDALAALEESFRKYFLGPEMEKMNSAFHNSESEYQDELDKIRKQKDLVVKWFLRTGTTKRPCRQVVPQDGYFFYNSSSFYKLILSRRGLISLLPWSWTRSILSSSSRQLLILIVLYYRPP